MATPKSRLGRGLGALIAGGGQAKANSTPVSHSAPQRPPTVESAGPSRSSAKTADTPPPSDRIFEEIAVARIDPNPYQPRRDFGEPQLRELADSIRAEGLLQPVVVRAVADRYQLIAGERRWRAFQLLKQKTIPARVVKATDATSAAMALIENLQRENLNPIEEARGYASLLRDFDLTQELVAERVGKARATVANALRLLQLAPEVQGFVGSGILSSGHAKVLLALEAHEQQLILARKLIEDGLSVRATEALVDNWKKHQNRTRTGARSSSIESAALADLEKRLREKLNAPVMVKHGARRGEIRIQYKGNDDLHRILEKLGLQL